MKESGRKVISMEREENSTHNQISLKKEYFQKEFLIKTSEKQYLFLLIILRNNLCSKRMH